MLVQPPLIPGFYHFTEPYLYKKEWKKIHDCAKYSNENIHYGYDPLTGNKSNEFTDFHKSLIVLTDLWYIYDSDIEEEIEQGITSGDYDIDGNFNQMSVIKLKANEELDLQKHHDITLFKDVMAFIPIGNEDFEFKIKSGNLDDKLWKCKSRELIMVKSPAIIISIISKQKGYLIVFREKKLLNE